MLGESEISLFFPQNNTLIFYNEDILICKTFYWGKLNNTVKFRKFVLEKSKDFLLKANHFVGLLIKFALQPFYQITRFSYKLINRLICVYQQDTNTK